MKSGRYIFHPNLKNSSILTAIISTAVTTILTLGPIHRVEEWLEYFEIDINTPPLHVRKKDHLNYFITLLNKIQKRIQVYEQKKVKLK